MHCLIRRNRLKVIFLNSSRRGGGEEEEEEGKGQIGNVDSVHWFYRIL
jgi:hypothetical protein